MYLGIYAELVKLVFDRALTLEPPRNPDGTVKQVADGKNGNGTKAAEPSKPTVPAEEGDNPFNEPTAENGESDIPF